MERSEHEDLDENELTQDVCHSMRRLLTHLPSPLRSTTTGTSARSSSSAGISSTRATSRLTSRTQCPSRSFL